MSENSLDIREFDPSIASDAEYEHLTVLVNRLQSESQPDEPPNSVEETRLRLQNIPPVFGFTGWVAWLGEEAVGRASIFVPRMDTNQHVAQFEIGVLSEHRRHGLGSRLLSKVAGVAQKEDRTLLVGDTRTTVMAGEKFMNAIGANIGLASHSNDLKIADLDRGLIEEWLRQAPERAAGFELVEWIGRYPEEHMDAVVEMMESINLMPKDDLEIEDFHWSPEQIRQIDDAMEAQGTLRWTVVAREESTGRFAGFTEMNFNPRKPQVADQLGTAVFREYQNRGLGRWMKAAMLAKVLAEKPEVERVRTGNAHSNAPMLKINNELGFRPSMTMNLWQVELDKVREYLKRRAGEPSPV